MSCQAPVLISFTSHIAFLLHTGPCRVVAAGGHHRRHRGPPGARLLSQSRKDTTASKLLARIFNWTWTVICDHTKLLASWRVGDRTSETAIELLDELAKRIEHRIQLTSDGLSAYLEAVEGAYGGDIDYAQLIKHYGDPLDADRSAKARYSPGECTGTHVIHVSGRPDLKTIGTSYVERSNLTVRMSLRRYTRLTNAFSKKIENHTAAFALYAFRYNWVRPHMALRTKRNNQITPAMAAGLTDWPTSFEDLVDMIDADYEARRPKTRGPYKPRKPNQSAVGKAILACSRFSGG